WVSAGAGRAYRAGDKAPYARGPDAVPPLPFGPSPGEGTGPNTQAVLEGSNDARTGMPPEYQGAQSFMLGSSAGAGPGARGLPGGRRNGGPAEATRRGDTKSPGRADRPRRTGGATNTIQCPHCSPSEPVRTQVIPSDRPSRALAGCGIRPSVGGPDPADTPTKGGSRGRLPPGIWVSGLASGQRSTDSIGAGDQTAPGLPVIPAMWGSRAFLSHGTKRAGTGPGACRGVTGAPIAGRSEHVDSLDDPTKDAARRPSRVETRLDGRLPPFLKRGPTEEPVRHQSQRGGLLQGKVAGAELARPEVSGSRPSHRTTDLDRADIVRANVPGPDPAAGAHFVWVVRASTRAPYKVGLSGSPVAWAARGLGHSRRLAPRAGRSWPTARPPGPIPFQLLHLYLFINYISALPCPATGLLRGAARYSLQEARAGQLVTPAARAPASIDPSACVSLARAGQLVTPGRARARPLSTPASVSVCLYKCLSMARPLPAGLPPPPPRAPANWPPSRARPHPDPSTPGSGPPRGASHRANSASQLATALPHRALTGAPPPPSPSPSPSSPRPPPPRHPRARTPAGPRRRRPPGPYNGARARLSARYEGARAGPTPLDLDLDPALAACLPACLPAARASDGLLLHIPTDPDRPQSCVQTFPGPKVVPGGGPLALAARAPPARPCAPANWPPPFVTRRRRARVPAAGQGARAAISAGQLAAGDKAPYARGPDAVPPLPFGPVPGEGTGPNTQAVLEGSNDARTGMPPGIPGGAILHTFRTAFMLGSSAGAGPGARGLPGGRRNGGPAEATRFTYGNLVTTFTSSK
ncbi:hypothetical protein ALT_3272, partial [Aspergillus lentulus]